MGTLDDPVHDDLPLLPGTCQKRETGTTRLLTVSARPKKEQARINDHHLEPCVLMIGTNLILSSCLKLKYQKLLAVILLAN